MLNLQKQIQEKDDAFRDTSEKLSRKSEECESLLEERDIMRSKNSSALQQVGLKTTTETDKLLILPLLQFEFA